MRDFFCKARECHQHSQTHVHPILYSCTAVDTHPGALSAVVVNNERWCCCCRSIQWDAGPQPLLPHSTREQDGALEGAGKRVAAIYPVYLCSRGRARCTRFRTLPLKRPSMISKRRAVNLREGVRESSFMYTLGVFLRPLDMHKGSEMQVVVYFWLGDAKCHSVKTVSPADWMHVATSASTTRKTTRPIGYK